MGFYGRNIDGKEVIERVRIKDVLWGQNPPRYLLRPCQECGATQEPDRKVDTVYYGFREGSDGWKAVCIDCGKETRFYRDEADAAREWNGGDIE